MSIPKLIENRNILTLRKYINYEVLMIVNIFEVVGGIWKELPLLSWSH